MRYSGHVMNKLWDSKKQNNFSLDVHKTATVVNVTLFSKSPFSPIQSSNTGFWELAFSLSLQLSSAPYQHHLIPPKSFLPPWAPCSQNIQILSLDIKPCSSFHYWTLHGPDPKGMVVFWPCFPTSSISSRWEVLSDLWQIKIYALGKLRPTSLLQRVQTDSPSDNWALLLVFSKICRWETRGVTLWSRKTNCTHTE